MSLVAHLNFDDMTCRCPSCDEIVEVEDNDISGTADGLPEYIVVCPECGQSFYTSEVY